MREWREYDLIGYGFVVLLVLGLQTLKLDERSKKYKIHYENGALKVEGEEICSTTSGTGGRGSTRTPYTQKCVSIGEKKEYYPDGTLKFEGTHNSESSYKFGHKYINSKSYYSTGKLSYESHINEDKVNNVIYYHRNGVIRGTETSGYSKKEYTEYDYYGILLTNSRDFSKNYFGYREIKTFYHNGKIETFKGYIEEKNYIYRLNYIKNGDFLTYLPDGRLLKKDIYTDGELTERIDYSKDLKLEGLIKFYYDSGKLYSTENWKNYSKEGESKIYYETGELKSEGNFSAGLKTGVWKTYYKNGVIESEGKYFDNLRNGKWEWFHENGTIKERGQYIKRGAIEAEYGLWESYDENGYLEYKIEMSY